MVPELLNLFRYQISDTKVYLSCSPVTGRQITKFKFIPRPIEMSKNHTDDHNHKNISVKIELTSTTTVTWNKPIDELNLSASLNSGGISAIVLLEIKIAFNAWFIVTYWLDTFCCSVPLLFFQIISIYFQNICLFVLGISLLYGKCSYEVTPLNVQHKIVSESLTHNWVSMAVVIKYKLAWGLHAWLTRKDIYLEN